MTYDEAALKVIENAVRVRPRRWDKIEAALMALHESSYMAGRDAMALSVRQRLGVEPRV